MIKTFYYYDPPKSHKILFSIVLSFVGFVVAFIVLMNCVSTNIKPWVDQNTFNNLENKTIQHLLIEAPAVNDKQAELSIRKRLKKSEQHFSKANLSHLFQLSSKFFDLDIFGFILNRNNPWLLFSHAAQIHGHLQNLRIIQNRCY